MSKNNKVNYEIEDLLEMLGGDKYYSMDNIMYVYHSLRNETDEAAYYMDILIQKEKALEKKLNKIQERRNKGYETLPSDGCGSDSKLPSACAVDDSEGELPAKSER